ncbi:MAG: transcriptional repressor [Deltaproteobacteria bacterium]|nr:transcriptional repressor [Deltaproteobacteria bacterium]
MINDSHFEKKNFRSLIESDEIGNVEERLNVIDAFLNTEEHVTLEEMMQLLKDRGFDYETEFVRQCMNRWVSHGFAQKKLFEGQPPRYEHRHLGRHHDHLICTKCGRITEFWNEEMEMLQLRIATSHGFHMLQHKMEIYGLCSQCVSERAPLMPLAMAKSGERLIIADIMGGVQARDRLASMGLRKGDQLEVINNDGFGRLIVGHDTIRIALGRGMAQKIMVSLPNRKPDEVDI